MNITTLGIDLAKDVFQLHGESATGQVVLKKKVNRNKLLSTISQLPKCLIGIEACGGSHYWARQFEQLGHEVKVMHPKFVKPYVQSDKNDANDSSGICEAVTRPRMRFVSVKTLEQQDMQSIHRVRSRYVKERTALSNQIRGFLLDYGVAIPKSLSALKKRLEEIFSDGAGEVTPSLLEILLDLREELRHLDEKIAKYTKRIEQMCNQNELCKRLLAVEGVGPMTATAAVASFGNAKQYKDGRQLAASLGLVPKQHSSGGKEQLLGITKRGDNYLRGLLIHGSRSVMRHLGEKQDSRSQWFRDKVERRGENKAVVAFANKQARVIWALLSKGEDYRVAA